MLRAADYGGDEDGAWVLLDEHLHVTALVRVVLKARLAVRLLDLALRCSLLDAQEVVEVVLAARMPSGEEQKKHEPTAHPTAREQRRRARRTCLGSTVASYHSSTVLHSSFIELINFQNSHRRGVNEWESTFYAH